MKQLSTPPHTDERFDAGRALTDRVLDAVASVNRPRSRYRPAVFHTDGAAALECLAGRYRSLQTLRTPAFIAAGCVFVVNLGASAVAPDWLQSVLWLWSGLLVLAALWHRLPPAFAAPDIFWRIARSIDPLEPASEADQQVLPITRFAWMAAGAYVLVANDLVREARLRFYDAAAAESADPRLHAAIVGARASADHYWADVALLVLGVAIALGVGRRLHAVDSVSYVRCSALSSRTPRGVGWYFFLTSCVIAAIVGGLYLGSGLTG